MRQLVAETLQHWSQRWRVWLSHCFGRSRPQPYWLREAAAAALREWHAAQAYFNSVTDPELVDHAIYCVESSRRKYVYLLRQVQKRLTGQTEAGP